jgi:hypothetical protein
VWFLGRKYGRTRETHHRIVIVFGLAQQFGRHVANVATVQNFARVFDARLVLGRIFILEHGVRVVGTKRARLNFLWNFPFHFSLLALKAFLQTNLLSASWLKHGLNLIGFLKHDNRYTRILLGCNLVSTPHGQRFSDINQTLLSVLRLWNVREERWRLSGVYQETVRGTQESNLGVKLEHRPTAHT